MTYSNGMNGFVPLNSNWLNDATRTCSTVDIHTYTHRRSTVHRFFKLWGKRHLDNHWQTWRAIGITQIYVKGKKMLINNGPLLLCVFYVWCYARARSGERGCAVELPDAEVEVPVPHMPANTKFWSRSMSNACSRLVCFKKNLDVYRSRPPRSGSRDSFKVSPKISRHKFTCKTSKSLFKFTSKVMTFVSVACRAAWWI